MAKRFYQFNKEARGENLEKRGGTNPVGGSNSGDSADDEIINLNEVTHQAQDFYEKYQKVILGVVLGLGLLIGGYFIYKYMFQIPKQNEAVSEMWQAENLFAQDSFASALENVQGTGFLDIIDSYGGTATANTAKYYAGISYLNLGKYESAIEMLEDYSPKDDITPAMKFGALGDAYAENNDLDKALDMYKKASTTTDNEVIAPYYMNKCALLAYKLNKADEAVATMKSLIEKFPTANEVNDAEKLIARIEAGK